MYEHRFREYFESQASAATAMSSAFVPCPMLAFGAAQAQYIQQVYAIAAERTREQLQPKRRPAWEFSLN